MAHQRLRGCLRERAARPDTNDPIIRLDQIAGAGQEERRLLVHDDEHRLEPAKSTVGAPVLGELDGGALEVAAMLLELGFEAREQRK